MLKIFLQTDNDPSRVLLRVVLGGVMFAHGAQKLFGWFGGHGYSATMQHFTEDMGIPFIFALLAVLAESVGALALVVGFLTRLAALGIAAVMLVAAAMVHGKFGFFMNWSGQQAGEGFEYHLLALAMATVLIIKGGGRWSVDAAWFNSWLSRKFPAPPPAKPAAAMPALLNP